MRPSANRGIRVGIPPIDPAVDIQEFRQGKPLVMRAHRESGPRFRYGVLVLNQDAPGTVSWHRGVLPRYARAGEALHGPFEIDDFESMADAPLLKRNPYTVVAKIRTAGEPLTIRFHMWDVALLCAALDVPNRYTGIV